MALSTNARSQSEIVLKMLLTNVEASEFLRKSFYLNDLNGISVSKAWINFKEKRPGHHVWDLPRESQVAWDWVASTIAANFAPPGLVTAPIKCGIEHNGRLVVSVVLREAEASFTIKAYSFFADPDVELFDGDIVVVDAQDVPQIAKVVSSDLSENELTRASKWVIGRVDMSAHEVRLAAERRLRSLQADMEKKVKNFEKNHKYLIMSQQDPEMAAMYEEMSKLDASLPPLPAGTKIAGQIEQAVEPDVKQPKVE